MKESQHKMYIWSSFDQIQFQTKDKNIDVWQWSILRLRESRKFVDVTHRNILLNGKQDDFRWKLYESKMTFVESSS